MSNILRYTAMTGAGLVLVAGGYLARTPIDGFVESHGSPADNNLMLDTSGMTQEAASAPTSLQSYGRNLARAILNHLPDDMDCADSCSAGTMDTSNPTDGKPQYKYEVFKMSDTNVVDVIATEYTPTVIENTEGSTVIDGSKGSGVSVLLNLPEDTSLESQPGKPLTAQSINEMLDDPHTYVSTIHVSSGNRFAALSRTGIEWGILGPKDVRNVEIGDGAFDRLLGQFVTAASTNLYSVEDVEDTTLANPAK